MGVATDVYNVKEVLFNCEEDHMVLHTYGVYGVVLYILLTTRGCNAVRNYANYVLTI